MKYKKNREKTFSIKNRKNEKLYKVVINSFFWWIENQSQINNRRNEHFD